MEPIFILVLVLIIAMPVAWFLSEFQSRKWLRLLLGCLAITVSYGVAYLVGSLQIFSDNAWFSTATARLLETTISEIEGGKSDKVVLELKHLRDQYHPTYENKGRYDVLVDEAVNRMKTPAETPSAGK